MKGMAALAFGLVAVSCNKSDIFNPYQQQEENQKKSEAAFAENVMNGQAIDPNQTWSTTSPVQVSVTPSVNGTLKIYAANPIGNIVAPFYTANVSAGAKTTFTVTKPADVKTLYAAVYEEEGLISNLIAFDASNASAEVNFSGATTNRAARRADDNRPDQPDTIKRSTLRNPTNDMPAKYDYYITKDTEYQWGFENGKNYHIAEGVTVTFGNNGNISGNNKIYMSPGSKVVKTSGTLVIDIPTVVYNNGGTIEANNLEVKKGVLWNEGAIKVDGKLLIDQDGAQLYNANGHTVKANKLEMNNGNQLLWNEGIIDIKEDFYANNPASAVNYGTFLADKFKTTAGAKFFNMEHANVEISDSTSVGNSNTVWVNKSTFTTGVFSVDQGHNQAFNNCRLTCTKKFSMGKNDGSCFVLDGYASVITEDFDWNGDGYFWLGGNSLLLVNDTLKSNNDDDNYGFYQYGDDYAVISAKAITTDVVDAQSRVCYFGKIYVDADSHFELKYVKSISKNNYMKGEKVKFTTEQFTAPVPDSWKTPTTCRPAYIPKDPEPNRVMYYYYAFEDLGTTNDFDFNDVVIRVSTPDAQGKSTVELMCAGGTMSTEVTYGTGSNVITLGSEVHEALRASSYKAMVNTGSGETKPFPVSLGTIEHLTAQTNMANLPFGIKCNGNNGQVIKVVKSVADNKGKTPLVIVVNGYPSGDNAGKWFWPTERTNITTAYPGFGAWGANVKDNADWYKNAAGSVYAW